MKKSFLITTLLATTALMANAKADEVNCYDACRPGRWCSGDCTQYQGFDGYIFYRIDDNNNELTAYGPSDTNATGISFKMEIPVDRYSDGTAVTLKGNITSLADQAFYANYKITSVNIPDTVTSIGKYAFQATRNLQTISLGNNITSIGSQAFLESGLSSITIPDSVTTIGTSVFRSMENLESVILGDKVNSIGSASFVGIPATAKIYCQDNDSRGKTCEELIRQNNQSALNQLQLFTRDNSGNMVLYDKNTDGTITSNGQTYADVSALKAALATSGNGNTGDSGTQTAPKRIYTVEEARAAVEAAGTETVNFRIRYK